ncbi:MAG: PAC2 family protein [Candidatus Iainarchaeum archaeon]|uniref:PAC2 family protein n=1 Tax=Candidatus Iainarchaeum sp. TaxID=3101447 RepID=A0A7T9DJU8_9ARCH|nr:MAG: PAC2 family protein [Candidatus Diapherotrites archaeon]
MVTQVWIHKKPSQKPGVIFVGLPGIGLVGKIVVDYFVKELKPTKIAEITCDAFPAAVLTKNGLVDLFKDEIHHFTHAGKDYYILSGPVQPNWDQSSGSTEAQYDFARTLITAFKELKIGEIYTLAGLHTDQRMTHKPQVVISATDNKTLADWKKLGAKADQPEGMVWGVAGMLLGIGKTQGIPGACLMGETSGKLVYGDPGASKAVIDLLIKRFHFKIKMEKMDSEAKQIETAFKKLADTVHNEEAKEKKGDLPYVR